MSYPVVVRGSAAKDVLAAFFWYHTIRPQLGDRYTAGVKFASIQEFAASEHNTFKSDYDDGQGLRTSHKQRSDPFHQTSSSRKILQRFEDGYRIVTDQATDEKMKAAAEATFQKDYSALGNECTTVVKNALEAGGLRTGEYITPKDMHGHSYQEKNYLPTTKLEEIERNNQGTDCDAQLERDDRQKCGNGIGED